MTKEAWAGAFDRSWAQYYTWDHIETIMRRAAACGKPLSKMIWPIMWFHGSITIENVHPLESGHFRRKLRRQRRHGMKLENPLTFYARRDCRQAAKIVKWYRLYRRLKTLADRIEADPAKLDYTDLALTPTMEAEAEGLEMLKVHGEAANELQRAKLNLGSGEPKQTVAAE
jgi:hypothetical protein